MNKRLLLIISTFIFIAFILLLLLISKGLSVESVSKGISASIKAQQQIQTQREDAEYRKNNPATDDEIRQMEVNKTLCFKNDDCRESPEYLQDCNVGAHNKYYCKANSCPATLIGCDSNQYSICENNACVKKML